ncbi:hypothetical protein BTHI11S_06330 [Bosea thiooxidans]
MEGAAELLGEPSDSWSVVHVETPEALSPTGLNRTLKLVALDSLDDVPALVAPQRSFLQTAGVRRGAGAAVPARAAAGRNRRQPHRAARPHDGAGSRLAP